jgi:hypothetical protein
VAPEQDDLSIALPFRTGIILELFVFKECQ